MNCWVAFEPSPFAAFKQSVYVPPVVDVAVAAIVAVPSPLSVKEIPAGNTDAEQTPKSLFDSEGVGLPVVVTLKLPAVPDVNVAESRS